MSLAAEDHLPLEQASPRFSVELALLVVICAGYVAWVLSVPLFPTQDGPVHLYYAHVMQALFSRQPTVYSQYYTIKHLLPPYSLYYYSLLFFGQFVSLVMADKLVICCYFVSFTFGFRYLARTVGPGADRMALLATLILVNWPLGMGFVNFCGSLSLALWCIGLYVRNTRITGHLRRALFLLLTVVVMLAHPVPVLAVLGYCVLDLALRGLRFLRQRQGSAAVGMPSTLKQDTVYVLSAMLTLVYVKLFTVSNALHQIVATKPFLQQIVENIKMYSKGRGITPFGGMALNALPARACVLLIVPVCLALAAWQCRRNYRHNRGRWTLADRWLVLALAMLAAMPFVPHDINASHYFADRLLLFVWLGALLAGSGFASRAMSGRLALILFAVAGNAFIFHAAQAYIRPAANEIALMEETPVTHEGQVGLLLDSDWTADTLKFGPLFNSYGWVGANYFRHNNAVLYNTPWLDLTVIPLGAQWTLPTGQISSSTLEDPNGLRIELLADSKEREDVLGRVNFVFVNRARARRGITNPLATGKADDVLWMQAPDLSTWYTIWDVKQPDSNR